MLTKELISDLLEALSFASITAIGFSISAPVGVAIMTGLGINLSSNTIQRSLTHLKEMWLSSGKGMANHDIQQALARAFIKALRELEEEYFNLPQANALPKDEQSSIKTLFEELRKQVQATYISKIQYTDKNAIREILYGDPVDATEALWRRIDGARILHTYNADFRDFLRRNFLNSIEFWFAEELKTDSMECNRAWRAFQLMQIEGLQADVKAMQIGHDEIQKGLKLLNNIKNQLDQIQDIVGKRLPNEPFQDTLEQVTNEMDRVLLNVAETTDRAERKFDLISKLSVGRLPIPANTAVFEGRQEESKVLATAWTEGHTQLIQFAADGGVGKSTLVWHWLENLRLAGYPHVHQIIDWSFYSQGQH
jgi:hypothetical protein